MWSWLCCRKNNQINNSGLTAPLMANGTKPEETAINIQSAAPSTPQTPIDTKLSPRELTTTQEIGVALAANSHTTAGASVATLAIFYFELTKNLHWGAKLPIYALPLLFGFFTNAWQDRRNNIKVLKNRKTKNIKDAKQSTKCTEDFVEMIKTISWPKRLQFFGEFAQAYTTNIAVYGPMITDLFQGAVWILGLSPEAIVISNIVGIASAIGEACMHVATSDHLDPEEPENPAPSLQLK